MPLLMSAFPGLAPQAVWAMALADFEVLAHTADEQLRAAERERAHAAADPIRVRR